MNTMTTKDLYFFLHKLARANLCFHHQLLMSDPYDWELHDTVYKQAEQQQDAASALYEMYFEDHMIPHWW